MSWLSNTCADSHFVLEAICMKHYVSLFKCFALPVKTHIQLVYFIIMTGELNKFCSVIESLHLSSFLDQLSSSFCIFHLVFMCEAGNRL